MCVFKYHAFIFHMRPPRWRYETRSKSCNKILYQVLQINFVARLASLANKNFVARLARIITNFNSGALQESCENFGSKNNFSLWIMILLVCESCKLHNISHFSLFVRLARLALIFSQEASLIFHKIPATKIAKQDSLSTLLTIPVCYYQRRLLLAFSQKLKEKKVTFLFLLQVFFVFTIFLCRKTHFFVISAVSQNFETCETRPLFSRNTKIVS